ncbi:MAG: 23S rRNA pseudouridine(2604) synthase RluF [Saprospiraceae bacterium]|jgi:23S rRNA pseudouridine2604 synthase|nr:23S rRNA pseudouridine(2604) synthase RluF [Saprospiraceae bacterium]MBL0023832.1 23S rRNA pseudouridine(2604) synthase RluF [Saprospiraceae bacterium]
MIVNEHISLNKYISDTGLCSRREADKIIEAGRVKINETIARKGNRVASGDLVYLDDELISNKPVPVYIAFHKPIGVVCTTDQREPDNIIDYLNFSERIFPVGRLDKMSQGLILLTNDGDIVNKILRAGNYHEKEYIVTVNKMIDSAFVKTMAAGVPILDTVTRPSKVKKINDFTFSIILTQGLNRQIRRMCEALGYAVKSLTRTRIMDLTLDGIPYDSWRYLTESEITWLMEMVKDSRK